MDKTGKEPRMPIFMERFSELRKEREMSQGAFAEFLDIARPTVGFYENGDRIPDAETLVKISQKCEVPTDWLLGISNIRRYENVDISSLGLSDEAIDTIKDFFTQKKLFKSFEKKDASIDENAPHEIDVLNYILSSKARGTVITAIKNYIDLGDYTPTMIFITKEGKCFINAQEMVDSFTDGIVPFTAIRTDNAIRDSLISELQTALEFARYHFFGDEYINHSHYKIGQMLHNEDEQEERELKILVKKYPVKSEEDE